MVSVHICRHTARHYVHTAFISTSGAPLERFRQPPNLSLGRLPKHSRGQVIDAFNFFGRYHVSDKGQNANYELVESRFSALSDRSANNIGARFKPYLWRAFPTHPG
jgi:hypothetical protein